MSDSVKTSVKRVFRSCWDNKGWKEGRLKYPPRITDSSQYVPMGTLVARFLRGDVKASFVPVYEVGEGADLNKAVDEMPVTRTDGFDLADVNAVKRRGKDAVRELRDKKAKVDEKPEVVAPKPAPGIVPGPEPAGGGVVVAPTK